MSEYFCEVLLEEIPAWMLDAARAALQSGAEKLFSELGTFTVATNATSRRLVLFLDNLPAKQADREEEVKGPPRKAAPGSQKKNTARTNAPLEGGDAGRTRRPAAARAVGEILRQRTPPIVEGIRWP